MPDFRVGKPRYRARLSAATSFAAGQNPLPLDTVIYEDPAGGAGSSYTVDRTGLYWVAGGAAWSAIATASRAVIYVHVDGVPVQQFEAISTAGFVTVSVNCHLLLLAGETVQLLAQRSPTLASTMEFRQTFMECIRMGPERWT